jgi:hypothetical protein
MGEEGEEGEEEEEGEEGALLLRLMARLWMRMIWMGGGRGRGGHGLGWRTRKRGGMWRKRSKWQYTCVRVIRR